MAVLEKEIIENQGLIKELDPNSIGIILDIIQKDIYTKPIESSVRENFSNAFDSIKEKQIALSILNGESKVEDHFVEDDRIETKDSIFDKTYYDKKYLDTSKNAVKISYVINDTEGRDVIYFKDYGVGLAGKRLAGYFRPGYSSKRLSKEMLGKFGAGSKSALSTNIEFYVVETWHNGYYTKVMIYEHHYKCILSKKEADKTQVIKGKKKVDDELVDAEEYIYWRKTDRSNGVTLSFMAKKHNKERFIEAVKSQLMYFGDDITFEIVENGQSYEPSFKAQILHETDLFIVSRNSYLTQPHILINRVNYNLVDFAELGMNKKFGGIAIKAGADDVDVNAPRESVKWTDRTRLFIQAATEGASIEAGKLLESKLSTIKNPVERYLAANRYNTSSDDSELIRQLKSFGGSVRMDVQIDPKDYLDVKTAKKLNQKGTKVNVFNIMEMYSSFKTSVINTNSSVATIAEMKSYSDLHFDKLYYIEHKENSYNIRVSMAMYINANLCNNKGFQFVTFNGFREIPMNIVEFIKTTKSQGTIKTPKNISMYKIYKKGFEKKELYYEIYKSFIKKYGINAGIIDNEIVKEYAKKIHLSEDPVLRQKVEEKTAGTVHRLYIQTKSAQQTKDDIIAKLKKEKKILPYRTLSLNKRISSRLLISAKWEEQYWFHLQEVTTADLSNIKGTIIYASTEDRDLLKSVAYMHVLNKTSYSHSNNVLTTGENENVSFIQIAKDNIKFFKEIPGSMDVKKYIKDVHKVEDGKLTIKFGNTINKFITGIYLHNLISLNTTYKLLENKDIFNRLIDVIKEEDIPNIALAVDYLSKFPLASHVGQRSEPLVDIKNNFKHVLAMSPANIDELINSFYSLSQIQTLPIEELEDKEKTLISNFKEVEIEVYDKDFIDGLEIELVKYKELIELVFTKYIIIDSSTRYDKSHSYAILNTLIDEKLVSLQ